MKKIFLLLISVILVSFAFGFDIPKTELELKAFSFDLTCDCTDATNTEVDLDKSKYSLNFFLNYMSLDYLGLGMEFSDKKDYYTTQTILFMKKKVKTGERTFNIFGGAHLYPIDKITQFDLLKYRLYLGYEYSRRDKLFGLLTTNLFLRSEIYNFGCQSRSYGFAQAAIPTILSGSFTEMYINEVFNPELSFKLLRYIDIPFVLDTSFILGKEAYFRNAYLGVQLFTNEDDKYYHDNINLGVGYEWNNFYPMLGAGFSSDLFEQEFKFDIKVGYVVDSDFLNFSIDKIRYKLTLINSNTAIPVMFYIDNKTGGIFIEL